MRTSSSDLRCDDCGACSVRMPEWPHDETEILCGGCGKSLGTIRQLRERLADALVDDPRLYADNDNRFQQEHSPTTGR